MARIDEYLAGAVSPRDYDITPAISALNLFLQRYARSAGVPVGSGTFIRYFFPRDEGLEKCDLGDGIEGLRGFFLSIRPSFTRLLIDVDVCVSAFVKPGNLAEVLLRSKKKLEDVATLPKGFLDSNIHVKLTHLGYSKPLFGIGPKPPNKMTYILDGVRRSAKNYFKQKYGKELLHDGDLPVVNVGSTRKPIWVPPELCEILPGAVYRGAFNSQAMFATNLPKHEVQFMVGQVFRTLGLTRHLGGQPLESVFDIQVRAKGIPLSL
ncbi:hypothetical protein BDN72DRAFT_836913 [Pluteus cervinus]|uniref:Uncharacterized protein n=1 Tax=Pluteus cervinus TaxID=181527 RepID=A0ACD3B308_9AGAR|nr:hypothetical protein BDN72DRAFT_836913 [Pluteus cervinus]